MARPLRILFKNAYYHVINRGQSKRKIFLSGKDYESFLKLIEEACQTYNIRIISYCLMPNHYHLLINTPDANLSAFMRQINGVYTQIFNNRHKEDGSLFKGRYKAIVVQEGSYLLRLIRYIHNNPLRANMVRCADYIYSSHNAFLKQHESSWLQFKKELRGQFKDSKNILEQYKDFMRKSCPNFSHRHH